MDGSLASHVSYIEEIYSYNAGVDSRSEESQLNEKIKRKDIILMGFKKSFDIF